LEKFLLRNPEMLLPDFFFGAGGAVKPGVEGALAAEPLPRGWNRPKKEGFFPFRDRMRGLAKDIPLIDSFLFSGMAVGYSTTSR
jgi:hypothetical protein